MTSPVPRISTDTVSAIQLVASSISLSDMGTMDGMGREGNEKRQMPGAVPSRQESTSIKPCKNRFAVGLMHLDHYAFSRTSQRSAKS